MVGAKRAKHIRCKETSKASRRGNSSPVFEKAVPKDLLKSFSFYLELPHVLIFSQLRRGSWFRGLLPSCRRFATDGVPDSQVSFDLGSSRPLLKRPFLRQERFCPGHGLSA